MERPAGRARVLVADDTEDVRETLSLLLTGEGYCVETVADGAQTVARCRAAPPDLLILDVFMPVADGLDVLRALHDLLPDMKVICFSGGGVYGLKSPLMMTKHLGADRILEKPIVAEELLQLVRELVG